MELPLLQDIMLLLLLMGTMLPLLHLIMDGVHLPGEEECSEEGGEGLEWEWDLDVASQGPMAAGVSQAQDHGMP